MPLDFGLLSMTELRNRPGEVLDRVADDGAAFIIERNGRQKACLVPLSAFFPDIQPTRIAPVRRCCISQDQLSFRACLNGRGCQSGVLETQCAMVLRPSISSLIMRPAFTNTT